MPRETLPQPWSCCPQIIASPIEIAFQADLQSAATIAQKSGDLITIGITPTWACPGFGYIERGKQIENSNAFEVIRFREKPDPDLAESFVRSGNFYWNAGIFIWSVNSILTEFNRHAPDLAEFVSAIRNSSDKKKVLTRSIRKFAKDVDRLCDHGESQPRRW